MTSKEVKAYIASELSDKNIEISVIKSSYTDIYVVNFYAKLELEEGISFIPMHTIMFDTSNNKFNYHIAQFKGKAMGIFCMNSLKIIITTLYSDYQKAIIKYKLQ